MLVAASLYATPPLQLRRRDLFSPGHSDTNLSVTRSTLTVSCTHLHVDGNTTVVVQWRILEPVNPLDWIGLYPVDEVNPFGYLEYRNHGSNHHSGRIRWKIANTFSLFRLAVDDELRVCFKYYHGISGTLRATSPDVTLIFSSRQAHHTRLCDLTSDNHISDGRDQAGVLNYLNVTLTSTALQCKNLRRSLIFQPHFYVKITPLAKTKTGNRQVIKTDTKIGCLNPAWLDLDKKFHLPVSASLLLEVKDKNRATLRHYTVGQTVLPVSEILRQSLASRSSNFIVSIPLITRLQTTGEAPCEAELTFRLDGAEGAFQRVVREHTHIPSVPSEPSVALTALANHSSSNDMQNDTDTAPIAAFSEDVDITPVGDVLEERTEACKAATSVQAQQFKYNTLTPPVPTTSGSSRRSADSGISQCSCSTDSNRSLKDTADERTPLLAKSREAAFTRPKSLLVTSAARGAAVASSSATYSSTLQRRNSTSGDEHAHTQHGAAAPLCKRCQGPLMPSGKAAIGNLPANWEVRLDDRGRILYVDHANRRTSWQHPNVLLPPGCSDTNHSDRTHRESFNKRYVNLRQTVGFAGPSFDNQSWPAVLFLLRPDFSNSVQGNANARNLYNQSNTLKYIVHRLRKDPNKYERYQHDQDFVNFLNLFADKSSQMPPNWEMRLDPSRKEFFIDHKNKRTTLVDPRLPSTLLSSMRSRRRARSAPDPDTISLNMSHVTYADHVVEFFRQPNVFELIQSRLPHIASKQKLQQKITQICKLGARALQRYTNDADIITVLSAFDEVISVPQAAKILSNGDHLAQSKGAFEAKLSALYQWQQTRGFGQGPEKLKLPIRRANLLKDAFDQISAKSSAELRMSKLLVEFDDEEGLDYGGPSREFFFLLSRELFNPYYGLFEYSANNTYTVQLSPMSVYIDNYLEWCYFCGRVLGLALIHRYLLDVFFTRPFYKALLNQPWTINDLESVDSEFHASLRWLQANEIGTDLQLTFAVTEDVGDQLVERELKPHGARIPVNESNKHEYIQLMVRWRLERGVKQQMRWLLKGFHELVEATMLSMFDAIELELLLSGTMEINIGDWQRHTEYKSGYHSQHVVIEWFWDAVQRFNNTQRLQLLQFVTGTSSVPYEGFAALRGSTGPKKFTIEHWGEPTELPRAHTCFNRLDLPPYPSFRMLYTKLLMAIEESSSYGIE